MMINPLEEPEKYTNQELGEYLMARYVHESLISNGRPWRVNLYSNGKDFFVRGWSFTTLMNDRRIWRRYPYKTGNEIFLSYGNFGEHTNQDVYAQMRQATLTTEAYEASNIPVERALHKAAKGDYENAGRLIREHIMGGAQAIAIARLARSASKTTIQKKEFGRRGAESNKTKGNANHQVIQLEAKKIISQWSKNIDAPSKSRLAEKVILNLSKEGYKLAKSTVRRHITNLIKEGVLILPQKS